jgi:hypothetical protein
MSRERATPERRRRAAPRRSARDEGNRRCRCYRRGGCERSIRKDARRRRCERRPALCVGMHGGRDDGCREAWRSRWPYDGDGGRHERCHKRRHSGGNRRRRGANRRAQSLRQCLRDGLQSGRSGVCGLGDRGDDCGDVGLHNRGCGVSNGGYGRRYRRLHGAMDRGREWHLGTGRHSGPGWMSEQARKNDGAEDAPQDTGENYDEAARVSDDAAPDLRCRKLSLEFLNLTHCSSLFTRAGGPLEVAASRALSAARLTQGVPWLCVPPSREVCLFDCCPRTLTSFGEHKP